MSTLTRSMELPIRPPRPIAKMGIALLGIALLAAILCATPPGFAEEQGFQKDYPLAAGGTFSLENVNGSVQIEGWDRDDVEVRALERSENGASDLAKVSIDVESQPGRVFVRTHYPKGGGAEVAVEYHVYIPCRILLGNVETVNGSVLIRGMQGGGKVRSVNGNVEVLSSSGHFSAKTTNGNVHLALSDLRDGAPMNLETVNGSVVLALPSTAGADLDVVHMNGDFYSDLPVSSSGSTEARAFRAKLGVGGVQISVRTINGGIRLLREPAV